MVGSVPLPNTETVLRQCSAAMPGRLKRIPDGETGSRNYFTMFQAHVFAASPTLLTLFVNNAPVKSGSFTPEEVDAGIEKLKQSGPLETGYDDAAIESYGVFKKMREAGVISKEMRFQVGIPTTPSVIMPFIQAPFRAKTEPLYEEALFRAIRKVQDTIPHEDLAIQIDVALDTAFWEGSEIFKPWFGDGDHEKTKHYMVDYIVRMIGQIDQDVEVGLHNCYGRLSPLRLMVAQ